MSKSDANATTMAAKPMLNAGELEAYLRARGRAAPVSCLGGLDGYLTAVLIGPKLIDPQLWLGQLLGERALPRRRPGSTWPTRLWCITTTAYRRRWRSFRICTGRSCQHIMPGAWTRSSGPSAS